jgi:uncharacterized protein YrzB (UPF0473 family)
MLEVKEIRSLRDKYGPDIILFDDKEESTIYHVLYEFALGDRAYAVLAPEGPEDDDEPLLYRIGRNEHGEPELESIDDEDEWETVSEIYDEWAFPVRNED